MSRAERIQDLTTALKGLRSEIFLSDSIDSDSDSNSKVAATPKAVKTAYDEARTALNTANSKVDKSGGTVSGDLSVTGALSVTGDLSVTENLSITGSLTVGSNSAATYNSSGQLVFPNGSTMWIA